MLLEVKNLNKSFQINNKKIKILNDLSFSIDSNEIISIYGASGSGKSTLLNIISGLMPLDSGYMTFNGELMDNNFIKLSRECDGLLIPSGEAIKLKKGSCAFFFNLICKLKKKKKNFYANYCKSFAFSLLIFYKLKLICKEKNYFFSFLICKRLS